MTFSGIQAATAATTNTNNDTYTTRTKTIHTDITTTTTTTAITSTTSSTTTTTYLPRTTAVPQQQDAHVFGDRGQLPYAHLPDHDGAGCAPG